MGNTINIEEVISLINEKTTTVDQLCKFIYKDIEDYQNEREDFYMGEFKEMYEDDILDPGELSELADKHSEDILKKIESDVKKFSVQYAKNSIDDVLDAFNEKKFKYKKSYNALLVLLNTLDEMNENFDPK